MSREWELTIDDIKLVQRKSRIIKYRTPCDGGVGGWFTHFDMNWIVTQINFAYDNLVIWMRNCNRCANHWLDGKQRMALNGTSTSARWINGLAVLIKIALCGNSNVYLWQRFSTRFRWINTFCNNISFKFIAFNPEESSLRELSAFDFCRPHSSRCPKISFRRCNVSFFSSK